MSLHPAAVRAARTLTVLGLALATTVALPGAADARAKPRPPITSGFFGVHHQGLHADGPIGWPQAPVGSVRMWDNRVSWREVEVAPGVFDWTLIDAQMAKARANRASVLLVLGQTPRSTPPARRPPASYGPGASAMPTKAAWVRYVQETARRNINVWGHIAQFQVWNEANVVQYWSGTAKQMATLTAWTRAALRAVDPSARLVAPALVSRLSSQQTWIKAFYAPEGRQEERQRVRRRAVASSSTRRRPARPRRR